MQHVDFYFPYNVDNANNEMSNVFFAENGLNDYNHYLNNAGNGLTDNYVAHTNNVYYLNNAGNELKDDYVAHMNIAGNELIDDYVGNRLNDATYSNSIGNELNDYYVAYTNNAENGIIDGYVGNELNGDDCVKDICIDCPNLSFFENYNTQIYENIDNVTNLSFVDNSHVQNNENSNLIGMNYGTYVDNGIFLHYLLNDKTLDSDVKYKIQSSWLSMINSTKSNDFV